MAYDLTGTLYKKFDTIQRTATFKVREFIVETSKDINGREIINYIKFQLVQDHTSIIDAFNEGEAIRVSFNIRGSKWEKNGQTSYFNNLDAWRIEKDNTAEQVPLQDIDIIDELPGDNIVSESAGEGDDLPF